MFFRNGGHRFVRRSRAGRQEVRRSGQKESRTKSRPEFRDRHLESHRADRKNFRKRAPGRDRIRKKRD